MVKNHDTYYQKLKELVREGRLIITAIVSPARTSSTLLLKSLSQSNDISLAINQPFHLTYHDPYIPPNNRENDAYRYIYAICKPVITKRSPAKVHMLIKEMAKNLGPGDQFDRFSQLVDNMILLVRNPLLTTESLLRAQVEVQQFMPEVFTKNLNVYASGVAENNKPFSDWESLKRFVLSSKKYILIEDLLNHSLFKIELNRFDSFIIRDYLKLLSEQSEITINSENKKYDYSIFSLSSATEFREAITAPRNYFDGIFSEYLNEIFSTSWTGWFPFYYIYKKQIQNGNSILIDSTLFRMNPDFYLKNTAKRAGISFHQGMLNPAKNNATAIYSKFRTDWMHHCFQDSLSSHSIRKAHEKPLPINHFPVIYQNHIRDFALPAYRQMCLSSLTLLPPKPVFHKILAEISKYDPIVYDTYQSIRM